MRRSYVLNLLIALSSLILSACVTSVPVIPVDTGSAVPGGTVTRGGKTILNLLGKPLQVGDRLPSVALVDINLNNVDLSTWRGEVLLLSVVPSLDTKVCERQTHILGEEGPALSSEIRRITISRDLPFAQKRFADETGFKNILFLSDYRQAEFGKATGLLVDQIYLLARSVIVVDKEGTVRYQQIVPELSHLPDMAAAFAAAEALLKEE